MATWLKQSTAIEIKLGPFVDRTDGFTPMTALTISQADVRLAKGPDDWAQKSEATSAVHEENGWYRVLLDATDTNTLGPLIVAVNESGALPVWREFMVMEATSVAAAVWDEAALAHTTGGTMGGLFFELQDNIATLEDAIITPAQIADAVWASTDRVITGLDGSAVDCFFNVNSGSGYTYQFAAGGSIIGQLVAAIQIETPASVWDQVNGIETDITPRGALRLNTAALAGKVSGAGTTTETFRNVGDSKNRIVSTVDASGNRTAVTTDVT
jgi:hypothetical protein